MAGTSRRYRARPDSLTGLHGALESASKWLPADQVPERGLAVARTSTAVVVEVDVDTDQATTFAAFIDPVVYSRWLGVPVRINGPKFAATMEWGTEVRGTYEVVCPPDLIAMRWDLDDDNPPVPGREVTGYLRVRPGRREAPTSRSTSWSPTPTRLSSWKRRGGRCSAASRPAWSSTSKFGNARTRPPQAGQAPPGLRVTRLGQRLPRLHQYAVIRYPGRAGCSPPTKREPRSSQRNSSSRPANGW